jgi:hypothetical protein
MDNGYDRLLKAAMIEFERAAVQQAERAFAALPDEVCKVPFIDEEYDPRASPEQHTEQKQRVIRALCCRLRFELDSPKRCQPLPLCEDERVAFNRTGDPQLGIAANYGMTLQGLDWHYERAPSFFDFIMQSAPPPQLPPWQLRTRFGKNP